MVPLKSVTSYDSFIFF